MLGRRKKILIAGARTSDAPRADLGRFDPASRGEWRWIQPRRFHAYWELEAGGVPVGRLRNASAFGHRMRFELADAVWELRSRLLHGIDLAREGGEVPVLHFAARFWGGGRIDSPAGEIDVARTHLFHRSIDFRTTEHHPLVRFESLNGFARHGARIAIEDAARTRDDLAPLLALGFRMLLMTRRRSQ